MDDLQFRRCIYADPNNRDEEVLAAMHADPAKQKFVLEVSKLDDKIAEALNVKVPDDLSNKLILRQTLASHQQQKRKTRVRFALAASVALVLGLTFNFNFTNYPSSYNNLGDYAIAHVNHEAQYFSNEGQANVTLASLNEKMSSFDGKFAASFGKLMFADFCPFDGMQSLHLVFKGEHSPVNVFIVPQDEQLTFSPDFSNEHLHGKSLQFQRSNIIVVTDKNESIIEWQKIINKNIRWST